VTPLPAIKELSELASNATHSARLRHVRSHANSLKVQTSRGNHLSLLSVHTGFGDPLPTIKELNELTANVTPLGEAAKKAIVFVACTCRLTQSPNVAWQLSLIAECMHQVR